MLITALTAIEAATAGFNTKISLTAADVATLTSGTAASIYPGFNESNTFVAGYYLQDAMTIVKTGFTGQTGTLTFGISDGTNQIINTGSDMTTTGAMQAYNLTKPLTYTTASKISITVTSQNAIASWSGGELDIYLNIVDVNLLNR